MEKNMQDKTIVLTETQMNKSNYHYWLKTMQQELNFSQSELARQADVSLTTIGRYMRGETFPDEKTVHKINRYINSLYRIDNFYHIDRKDFTDFLNELIDTFKVTQSEIARKTGISQPYISDYTHHDSNRHIPTKAQYDILNFFLEYACAGTNKILPEYEEIANRIKAALGQKNTALKEAYIKLSLSLRFSEEQKSLPEYEKARKELEALYPEFEDALTDESYKWASERLDTADRDNNSVLAYFEQLPLKVKRLIVDNDLAFLKGRDFFYKNEIYSTYKNIICFFRILSQDEKDAILHKMEEKCTLKFRPDTDVGIFTEISQYCRLMSEAENMPEYLKEKPAHRKEDKELNRIFKANLLAKGRYNSSSLHDFKFRLRMSAGEWYFLLLLTLYVYNGYSAEEIFKEICTINARSEDDRFEELYLQS